MKKLIGRRTSSYLYFKNHTEHIIFDEAQDYPELFSFLRGHIDRRRSEVNRFIVTGSSSPDLLHQAAETSAGRVAVPELVPLKMNEIFAEPLPAFYIAVD